MQDEWLKRIMLVAVVCCLAGQAFGLPMQFETAAVGRVQGETIEDLARQVNADTITINGADYYTTEQRFGSGIFTNYSKDAATSVLEKAYGSNNVDTKVRGEWGYDTITANPAPKDRALIIQTKGNLTQDGLEVKNGYLTSIKAQNTDLKNAIAGENLTIIDSEYAGAYLPTMGLDESLASQLFGKANAIITTNGIKNPEMLKAIACSLALEDASFGNNDYYKFNSIGDRFRNAKNNLQEFGSGGKESITSDYALYGAPYQQIESNKVDATELEKLCGDYANYNTYPFAQTTGFAVQETGETYTKTIELDFADYTKEEANGFEIMDINGTLQKIETGSKVMPYAIASAEFPLGTIIKDVKVKSISNDETINANIPMWDGESLEQRNCADSNNSYEPIEFSERYTENKLEIIARANPLEETNCEQGTYTLHRQMELEITYSPYSPILINSVETQQEYLPEEIVDANIIVENITPNQVTGTLRISDGNSNVAEQKVILSPGEKKQVTESFQLGKEEGYYDYLAVFSQGEEDKTASNFKVKADELAIKLGFEGGKFLYQEYDSGKYRQVSNVETFSLSRGTAPTMQIEDYGEGARFRMYSKASNAMGDNVQSGAGYYLTSKPEQRFSINDLPLMFKTGESYIKVRKNQPRGSDNWQTETSEFGGNYYIEKENEETIKWKKGENGAWHYINVEDWNKDSLGFETRVFANTYFDYSQVGAPSRVFAAMAKARISIMDGKNTEDPTGNYADLFNETLELGSQNDPDGFFDAEAVMTPIEIAWDYKNSARKSVFLNLEFENKGLEEKETNIKYLLQSEGETIQTGSFEETIPTGRKIKEIRLDGFEDYTKDYSLTLEATHDSKSKVLSLSFSGNNKPAISATSYIHADAYDTINLNYKITDADNDELTTTISEPFTTSNVWETSEADIGTHIIEITASDPYSTTVKTITIEIEEPKIECSVDLDCGNISTADARVCEQETLFAKEVKPTCTNPGTYYAYCENVDQNRVYGTCDFEENFAEENQGIMKFEGSETKELHLEVPRKAIIQNAFLQIQGEPEQTKCFDAVTTNDSQNTTAKKYSFANGTQPFYGLPLGQQILTDSMTVTSDPVGYNDIHFTPSQRGIASALEINAYCNNSGWLFELSTTCSSGAPWTYTENLKASCQIYTSWFGSGLKQPTYSADIPDFCVWEPTGQTANFNVNNHSYSSPMGYFGGIGIWKPSYKVYLQQFQTGKELTLGSISINPKTVRFSANENTNGQSIEYYVMPNGTDWQPINNGETKEFTNEEIGGEFNWKAVLNTSHEGITPRIYSTSICVDNLAAPDNTTIRIGPMTIFSEERENGFAREIDITSELNAYLDSLPPSDENALIPITFTSGSRGIIKLRGVGYEYDIHANNAPAINDINEQYAITGEEFALQTTAFDYEGDTISFADNTGLFDINSQTGLIIFTPKKEDAGTHEITITASDGYLASEAEFTLNIECINKAPIVILSMDKNTFIEGETVTIDINASDSDEDTLFIEFEPNTFDLNNSKLTWQTTNGDAGDYNAIITVNDGTLSSTASTTFTIRRTNTPPQITGYSPEETAIQTIQGNAIDFNITAVDPDNDALTTKWLLDGIEQSTGETFTLETSPISPGNYEVKAIVSDGNQETEHYWLTTIQEPMCKEDADCNDSDYYTFDTCTNTGTPQAACLHENIACISNEDCDDENPETIDACDNPGKPEAQCNYARKLCETNSDCNDSNDYTLDYCSLTGTINAQCQYTNIECTNNSNCDDEDPATNDACQNQGSIDSYCTHNPKPMQCLLEPEQGPCKAIFTKYYYNLETGNCEEFVWGGCEGVVPFETMQDCENICENTEVQTQLLMKEEFTAGETITASIITDTNMFYHFEGTVYSSPWKLYKQQDTQWKEIGLDVYQKPVCSDGKMCSEIIIQTPFVMPCSISIMAEGCYQPTENQKQFNWNQQMHNLTNAILESQAYPCYMVTPAEPGTYKLEYNYFEQKNNPTTCGSEQKTISKQFTLNKNTQNQEGTDLAVQKMIYNYKKSGEDYNVTIYTGASNFGTQDSDQFTYTWFVDNQEKISNTDSIPANTIHVTNYHPSFTLPQGNHEIKLVLDTQNTTTEYNEQNNEKTIQVLIS